MGMRRGVQLAVLGGFALAAVCAAPAGAAFTSFPDGTLTGATDVVTGFPTCSTSTGVVHSEGPIGVLVDSAHIFASDTCNATLYRFGAGGGTAGAPQAHTAGFFRAGLAQAGPVYYGVGESTGAPRIFSFAPTTLASPSTPVATLGSDLGLGLAVDPVSGDLFASAFSFTAGGSLLRVQSPTATGSAGQSTFASGHGYDGLAFTADGSRLYVADATTDDLVGYDRVGNKVLDVHLGSGVDGIAVARPHTSINAVDVSGNVFVNSNDGSIRRVDVNNANAVSVAAAGGTRGDFVAIGPDGCMYATQSSTIAKLAPCFFEPPAVLATSMTTTPAIANVSTSPGLYLLNLSATLSTVSAPVVGRVVSFTTNSKAICSARTDASGTATCSGLANILDITLARGYQAAFAGDAGLLPTSAHNGLVTLNGQPLL